jgi:hypothetical protein
LASDVVVIVVDIALFLHDDYVAIIIVSQTDWATRRRRRCSRNDRCRARRRSERS